MKKRALHKDFFVEIRKSLNRFISIFFIVAMGVAFYSGIQSAAPDMRLTGDAYFDDSKLMDIKVIGTLGLKDADIQALLEVDGIRKAEPGYMVDVLCGSGKNEKVLHIESMVPTLNQIHVSEGRLPEKTGECFVDGEFLESYGYKVGDTIHFQEDGEDDPLLKSDSYKIVGMGSSPMYISFSKGNSSLGTGEVSGYGFVLPQDFDQEAYTFAYLEADGGGELTAYTQEYDDLIDRVAENVKGIEKAECARRFGEVKGEADEKLADAEKELADGKKEADEKLADARQELTDGEKKLVDGKKELSDAEEEIDDNAALLEEKEQELADGRTQLADGQRQLEDGKSQLAQNEAKYQEEYPAAAAKLTDGEKAIADGKAQLEKGKSDYEDGKKKLADAKKQYRAGLKLFNDGKDQYEEGARQLEEARQQYEQGVSRIAESKKQYEDGVSQLTAAKAEYQKNAAVLAQGRKEIEAGQTQYDEGMAQYQAGMAALDLARQETDARRGELEAGIGEYEQAKARLAQAKDELAQLEALIADGSATQEQTEQAENLRQQIAVLGPALEEQAALIETGKQQLAAAEQQIADTKAQLLAAHGKLEVFEQKKQELEAGEAALAAGKAEIDENESKLAQAKKLIDQGEKEFPEAKKQIDENTAKLKKSKKTLDEKEGELAKAKKTLDEQDKVLEGAKETLEDNTNLLAEKEKELEAGKAQLGSAKSQLEAAKKQLSEKEAEFLAAKQTLEDGQKQIEDGKAKLESGRQDVWDAKKEISDNEQKLTDGQKKYNKAEKKANRKLTKGEKKIEDAKEQLADLKEPKWYVNDRSSLPENTGYGENADRIRNIGQVFPILFFLVAALISLTTMTRMVEEQRTQIGTLKALGYRKFDIAAKYLSYALLATIGGSILGILVGEKILPYIIITAYGIMYHHMSDVALPYNLTFGLMATGAAVCCTMIATFAACYKELAETPAKLMRPPTPRQGKRVLLERVTIIWKHLNFTWKSTVRNLFRYKKRFFMTIFGIGGCMALILVGYGIRDSIMNIAVLQYSEIQLYDGTVLVNEDASGEDKEALSSYIGQDSRIQSATTAMTKKMTVKIGKKELGVYLTVPNKIEGFDQFVHFQDRKTKERYPFDEDGVIITEKTADMMGVSRGDTIQIYDEDGGVIEAPVSEICENYLSHYIYMGPELYQKVCGREPDFNSILFSANEDGKDHIEEIGQGILDNDAALSVSYTGSVMKQLDDMLSALDVVIVVLIVSAGMLAFVVLYNLNNINVNERKRELATIKVLGFYDNEVCAYVYRENILLTFFGILLGVVLGIVLHRITIVTVEVDACMFGRNINLPSFIYAILFTIGFSLVVNIVMYFKLKKIDMVESLKSVE